MGEFTDPLALTSPHMKGQRVRDAQWLLSGNNRFKENYRCVVDGDWGTGSAAAADRARYRLGYPLRQYQTGRFGQQIYDYLRTDGKHKRLPPEYQVRRAWRLRLLAQQNTHKVKALNLALADARAGVTESPYGSNRQKYGVAYGMNGVPWCMEAVWYWFKQTGPTPWKTAWAYQPEIWGRAGWYHLSITHHPEPGDIVVYHHGQGHVGIFRRWISQSDGTFEAVEGNTSVHGSQDNGGAVLVRTRHLSWAPTVFVRVGA
jgi:hypothetical protein